VTIQCLDLFVGDANQITTINDAIDLKETCRLVSTAQTGSLCSSSTT
jgi:hypothetical protein